MYIPRRESSVAGTSLRNYVNWLAEGQNGLQLEQSPVAGRDDWEAIVGAVSKAFAEL